MAIVDLEFKAWVAQMEGEFPQMFHDETASRVAMDFRLDIARMAFTAGRAAQRKALSHAAGQEETTNPAEIGRKSVGGEGVAIYQVSIDGMCEWMDVSRAEYEHHVSRGTAPTRIAYLTPAQPPASAEVGPDAVMAWPEGWKIEHTDNAKWPLRITEPHGINAWEMDAGNLACRFLIAAMAASSGRKGREA